MDRADSLIKVLLDPTARIDEQHDAAMDLGLHDDDRSLKALLTVILDPNTDHLILDACGESIVEIWVERSHPDLKAYQEMPIHIKDIIYRYIKGCKPEWLEKYSIQFDKP